MNGRTQDGAQGYIHEGDEMDINFFPFEIFFNIIKSLTSILINKRNMLVMIF
jgi:hypothetical protein